MSPTVCLQVRALCVDLSASGVCASMQNPASTSPSWRSVWHRSADRTAVVWILVKVHFRRFTRDWILVVWRGKRHLVESGQWRHRGGDGSATEIKHRWTKPIALTPFPIESDHSNLLIRQRNTLMTPIFLQVLILFKWSYLLEVFVFRQKLGSERYSGSWALSTVEADALIGCLSA